MATIKRTTSEDLDFKFLVDLLDADLAKRDGKDHDFYHQFNSIADLKHAVVLYINEKPLGCGAIKPFDSSSIEVKRMYVIPESRGKGLAKLILKELEEWAATLKYKDCILETGKRQPEAIALYKKSGYSIISNYGQYIGIENSVCFRKSLKTYD